MADCLPPEIPAFERHLQSFLTRRGTDIDAQAAVFNLDHAAMDVIGIMEGLALRPHDLTHAGSGSQVRERRANLLLYCA